MKNPPWMFLNIFCDKTSGFPSICQSIVSCINYKDYFEPAYLGLYLVVEIIIGMKFPSFFFYFLAILYDRISMVFDYDSCRLLYGLYYQQSGALTLITPTTPSSSSCYYNTFRDYISFFRWVLKSSKLLESSQRQHGLELLTICCYIC